MSRLVPDIRPHVVAERAGPIMTDIGVMMAPNCTFAELPPPYAFFVPGSDTATLNAMSNLAIRRYSRTAAQDASWIVSVCTGALILAAVGLLEGREVTTHWAYTRFLKRLDAFGGGRGETTGAGSRKMGIRSYQPAPGHRSMSQGVSV